MDEEFRRQFEALMANVERGDAFGRSGPFVQYGFGPQSLLFIGESFKLLNRLTSKISDSALGSGGWNWDEAQKLVVRTLQRAMKSDVTGELSQLEVELARPMSDWFISEQIKGGFSDGPRKVGKAMIHISLETIDEDQQAFIASGQRIDFNFPILSTTVKAYDHESAKLRAEDIFDDAKSVLILGSASWSRPSPPMFIIGESTRFSSGHVEAYYPQVYAPDSWFGAGIRGLERAARKDFALRSDWERRCLSAARWFRRANSEVWPSSALSASMTALDILFVRDRNVVSKGATIATQSARIYRFDETASIQFQDWLRTLYQSRNDVVHDGWHTFEDDEIQRLLGHVERAIRWACGHLDDEHSHDDSVPPSAGFDFDQVMATLEIPTTGTP